MVAVILPQCMMDQKLPTEGVQRAALSDGGVKHQSVNRGRAGWNHQSAAPVTSNKGSEDPRHKEDVWRVLGAPVYAESAAEESINAHQQNPMCFGVLVGFKTTGCSATCQV